MHTVACDTILLKPHVVYVFVFRFGPKIIGKQFAITMDIHSSLQLTDLDRLLRSV